MSSIAREALFAVVESSYGTAKTSPVLGTDSFYFNLPDSDAFQGVMTPVFQEIDLGAGIAVPLDVVAQQYTTSIAWKGFVYPSLQAFLLPFFLTRVNSAQTSPWTTTEPPNDLASASFYKLWTPRGGTAVRKLYPGSKGSQITLSCSRQSPILAFSATVLAQKEQGNPFDSSSDPTSGVFAAPTDSQLPLGPYLFNHSAANVSFNSVTLTNYLSLSISIQNTIDVVTCENAFPAIMACTGRQITATFQRILTTTPNYRTEFQGVADYPITLEFNNGTHSFTLNFGSHVYINAYTQQLGKGKEFLETVTAKVRYDPSVSTDCTLTMT